MDDEDIETWESFTSRFSRVSDIFIMQYLRTRVAIEEPGYKGTTRDYLNKAEKLKGKCPRKRGKINPSIPKISHTTLYTQPKVPEGSRIMIFGNGRSTYWTALHFPDTQFPCISPGAKKVKYDPDVEFWPSNLTYMPYEEIENGYYSIEAYKLRRSLKYILRGPSGKGEFTNIVCAVGLRFRHEFTACVNPNNLLPFPDPQDRTNERGWVGPSVELPKGSLMEATLRWASLTNNLSWAYETNCFHPDYFIDVWMQICEEHNIKLPLEFFDTLASKLNTLKFAVETPCRAKIYKSAYCETCKKLQIPVCSNALNFLERRLIEIENERNISKDSALTQPRI